MVWKKNRDRLDRNKGCFGQFWVEFNLGSIWVRVPKPEPELESKPTVYNKKKKPYFLDLSFLLLPLSHSYEPHHPQTSDFFTLPLLALHKPISIFDLSLRNPTSSPLTLKPQTHDAPIQPIVASDLSHTNPTYSPLALSYTTHPSSRHTCSSRTCHLAIGSMRVFPPRQGLCFLSRLKTDGT
ncbi:hypothetical protein ACOSP7_026978 [Xanthoceras sorbifolium]